MSLYLKNLFGKLNETTRAALEGATALCVSRGHVHIEIEHYLSSLLPLRNTDLARICARFEIDTARLELELQRSLHHIESGSGSPALSPALVGLLRDAWCVASLNFAAPRIRSGFTVLALIDPAQHHELPAELRKLSAAGVQEKFAEIVRKSVEKEAAAVAGPEQPQSGLL